MKTLTTKELQAMKHENSDLVLVNTLKPEYFEIKHIPGSINGYAMDKDFVETVRKAADSESTPIAVYCINEECDLSATGVERLETAGFRNVYEYDGGTEAWEAEGLELAGKAADSDKKETSGGKEGPAPAIEDTSETASQSEDDEASEETEQTEASQSGAPESNASAHWTGGLKGGAGRMRLGGVTGVELPYSFESRFGDGEASSPEDLLGAALAGCFSMALAKSLGEAGYTPKSLETSATVSMAKDDGGFRVATATLELSAEVDKLEEAELQDLATSALEGCPISKALPELEKKLTATLS